MSEPPPTIQIAEAQEMINHQIDASVLAPLKIISYNVKLYGSDKIQNDFKLTYSELRGIITRSLGQDAAAQAKAKADFTQRAKAEIIESPKFAEFWFGTAGADDPLMR